MEFQVTHVTQTSSWILDLARTLPPTAQLDGFDIDISQTPPQSWIPRNVTFEQMDATEVLPDKVIGKYDVVYVRLFVFVVRNNDPQSILANLARMLSMSGIALLNLFELTIRRTRRLSSMVRG